MNANKSKQLTPNQVAIDLGCSVKTVLSEIRRRRMRPVLHLNKRVILIPEETLFAYKRERLA